MLTGSRRASPEAASSDRSETSAHLCRVALDLYREVLQRQTWMDPDCGFALDYESGRRSIEARAEADAWTVPAPVLDDIERLFETTRRLPEAAIGEWIVMFPRKFLGSIDRRASRLGMTTAGRRRFDRYARPEPVHRSRRPAEPPG